jgi:hypothetical protein
MSATFTQSMTPTQESVPGRTSAIVAVVAVSAAAAAIILAGVLDPGYSARSEAGSALASLESQSAPVMIVGFCAMALTLFAVGRSLFVQLRGKAAKVASVLLMLAGALTIGEAGFRQDCSTLQESCLARESAGTVSGHHVIHNLLAIPLFLFLVVASFLIAAALRRAHADRRLVRASWLVAALTVVFFVWFGSGAYGDNGGLVQRGLLLATWGWPVFVAARLSRVAR